VVLEEKSYTCTHPLGYNWACNGNTLPLLLYCVLFHKSQDYNFQLWCDSPRFCRPRRTHLCSSPVLTKTVLTLVLSCQSLDDVHVTKRRRNHIYWFLFEMSCFNYQLSLRYFFPWRFDSIFLVMVSLHGASRSHSLDTQQSVGVLWESDQPDA
jgi:hypothetical protein